MKYIKLSAAALLMLLVCCGCHRRIDDFLPPMSYISSDSAREMILGDHVYHYLGTDWDLKRGPKAAYITDQEKTSYAYHIRGRDDMDYLIVEYFQFMGNARNVYVRDDVETIAEEFSYLLDDEF